MEGFFSKGGRCGRSTLKMHSGRIVSKMGSWEQTVWCRETGALVDVEIEILGTVWNVDGRSGSGLSIRAVNETARGWAPLISFQNGKGPQTGLENNEWA